MTVNTSEAFAIVGDWISEHYFTDDGRGETFLKQIKALRKQWDEDAKAGYETPVSRFSSSRVTIQESLAQLASKSERVLDNDETVSSVYARLRNVLGHNGDLEEISFERAQSDITVRAVRLGETVDVLWLDAQPLTGLEQGLEQTQILGTNLLDHKQRPEQPVSKLITELYLSEPKPRYIVVAAGNILFLTDRERWPEGRYLAADVQLIAERNETQKAGEIDRLLAIFSRNSLVPDDAGSIWWDERLDESQQHAVGVSQELRDGIRESIEIIANDVLARRRDCGLSNENIDGQELARQSLRFLYRILFLLYAEAYPELGVLPKGAGEYDAGYGIDRLRELALVELTSTQEQSGTHLYESLALLFGLVNGDHPSQQQGSHTSKEQYQADGYVTDEGLAFESLEADLFRPEATDLINASKLGNHAMQQVLQRLLLSKSGGSGPRGFISYANLGINQLGAVYEGLMSYTGFIAETDLREVAKNGDASKGSWVVSAEKAQDIDPKHFVTRTDQETGLEEPVLHEEGSFVFRLSGRERQQSASYYTPEVMTKFVVSQALAELLVDDTPADKILELSICEPALGSGAFVIEAVRQLADEYLKRKQRELGKEIAPEEYAQELQRVKAQIALHQVYGVDLNATAVELAEVSLWLDTMQPNLHAPWFGLRLKRGNSLVGARRAVYSEHAVRKKEYLTEAPKELSLQGLADSLESRVNDPSVGNGIHHFLLPADGWGSAANIKEIRDLAANEQKDLRDWSRSVKNKLSPDQVKKLQGLAQRVEILWKIATRRLQIAEFEARRFINHWPHEREAKGTTVTREKIEQSLVNENGAYRRLKRVMDAWTALWYWPLTEREVKPPTIDEWISAVEKILGTQGKQSKVKGQFTLDTSADWEELNKLEELELQFAFAAIIDEDLFEAYPWLKTTERVALEQGFFHWELEFAPVFARGGFDLQVGNPPWVRPTSDEAALLAEFDPWWQLASKPTQRTIEKKRRETLDSEVRRDKFIEAASPTQALAGFLRSRTQYPLLAGLQPDLYRVFMEKTWSIATPQGVVALVHPESHFTEERARNLRAETYRRLRRHWQFVNELMLYDIADTRPYGVHIYGERLEKPDFIMAASLYHPDTVERSLNHRGHADIPGLKDPMGRWDTRPHKERILRVTEEVLKTWARILEKPGTSPLFTRMVYPVNRDSMKVLEKMSKASRIYDFGLNYSSGWHESGDRRKGYLEVGSKINESWENVILQGPHFAVANPFARQPNPTMRNSSDYTDLDLESLPTQFIPRTSYQPATDRTSYDEADTIWTVEGQKAPSRGFYRIAVRNMLPLNSYRTLYAAIIPPAATHVHAVSTIYLERWNEGDRHSLPPNYGLVLLAGYLSTFLLDFWIKLAAPSTFSASVREQLPFKVDNNPALNNAIVKRTLRLQVLTSAYSELYSDVTGAQWQYSTPLRREYHRYKTQTEVDVLVAMSMGITADELCLVYRTQFPVQFGYDQTDLYDNHGRKLPREMNKLYRKGGEACMTLEERTWVHPQSEVEYVFELPFTGVDREADMREAYDKFTRMLEEYGRIIEDEG